MNRRQLRQCVLDHGREEIANGCERDLCFGMGRAQHQAAGAALAGASRLPCLPSGLADPRIPFQQQCLPAGGHSLKKPIQRQQFPAPADDLNCHLTLRPGDCTRLRFA